MTIDLRLVFLHVTIVLLLLSPSPVNADEVPTPKSPFAGCKLKCPKGTKLEKGRSADYCVKPDGSRNGPYTRCKPNGFVRKR